jgi:hypothetical protein
MEGGIELGILKDRILLSANYYRNRSSNQLVDYDLSTVTGFTSALTNWNAKIQNSGIEISLNTENIKSKNLKWTTNINFSFQRNKLISFPGLETSPYSNNLIIGQPIGLSKVLRYAGVDPASGVYEYYTTKGERTTTPDLSQDRTKILHITPDYFGGFSNNISYKGFELSFLFQFVKQKGRFLLGTRPGAGTFNQIADVLDRWQKPGDMKPVQKFSRTSGNDAAKAYSLLSSSDYGITDASYIKLRNVSLSYNLPDAVQRKLRFSAMQVFIRSQNLLTITNYPGRDPETQSNFNIPPLFMLTGGIHLTL